MSALLESDYLQVLEAYLDDPKMPLRAMLEGQAARLSGDVDLVVSAIAVALLRRLDMAAAERWAIRASQELDYSNARFLSAIWAMADRDAAFLSCDLFDRYLRNGGEDREAHEFAIGRHFARSDKNRVLQTYQKAKRWFDPLTMARYPLFCVAVALTEAGDAAGAMTIFSELLRRDPSDEDVRRNVSSIAREFGLPEAVARYRETTEEIVKALPAYVGSGGPKASLLVDLARQSVDAVYEALNQTGLCHVKGGCDPVVVEALLKRVQGPDYTVYPAVFVEDVIAALPKLYRFDARKLASDSLGRPADLDLRSSTVRKVDPSDADSFTPFHQDVTAFQRLLVNIWTPLTRAGGEYPTVQFVAKRIQHVEQTMLSRPGYVLIAIEEAQILKKYQDLLYEATNVEPGDCIVFLGTTIHRSTNLDRATKPRFNLEARWA